ncbi:MAG: hypothetical protein V1787_02090 [Candidatus Micrarchaeota archaeon]
MEAVTTNHLKKTYGARFFSTPFSSSGSRRGQVERWGLKAGTQYHVDSWMKGLGKGLRGTLQKRRQR